MKPLIPARRRGIVYVQLISRLYNRPVEGCLPMFKVLVVEDDRDLRQLFTRVLQRSGYETLEAGDGQQALEVLEREYVDVIISDIMMPVMDGYELVRSLREADMNMPVLMITAKDAFDDMRRGFLSGTDDYMIKPVNVNEMVLRVGALLRRAQAYSVSVYEQGFAGLYRDGALYPVGESGAIALEEGYYDAECGLTSGRKELALLEY